MTKTFSSSQAELTAGTPSLCTHSWRFFLGALPTAPLLSFSLLHTIEILHRIPNRGQCKVVILLGHIGEWSPSEWCSTAAAIGAYWEVNNLLKRVIREYFRPIGPEVKATSLTSEGWEQVPKLHHRLHLSCGNPTGWPTHGRVCRSLQTASTSSFLHTANMNRFGGKSLLWGLLDFCCTGRRGKRRKDSGVGGRKSSVLAVTKKKLLLLRKI